MKLKISIRRVREKELLPHKFTGQMRLGCPSCGAKVYTEDRYCHHCGQPFSRGEFEEFITSRRESIVLKRITNK